MQGIQSPMNWMVIMILVMILYPVLEKRIKEFHCLSCGISGSQTIPDTLANGTGDYNDGLNVCFGTNCDSSFVRAKEIWLMNIIPNYLSGNINESYYHLGRVAHLLEDATQPSHVHLDPHIGHAGFLCGGLNDDCDDSFLEEFTAQQNYFADTQNKMNVEHYAGETYENKTYKYENLISGFNWSNEVIFADVSEAVGDGSFPGEVFVLNGATGTNKTSYIFGNGGAYDAISVANIDSDDYPEIVVAARYGIKVLDYDKGGNL